MRTLIILIALVLIVIAAKRLWQTSRPGEKPRLKSGQMVQCENCGVYIPTQEALQQGEHYYCSQAHLDESSHPDS